jgi:hypothetical protein
MDGSGGILLLCSRLGCFFVAILQMETCSLRMECSTHSGIDLNTIALTFTEPFLSFESFAASLRAVLLLPARVLGHRG